MAFFSAVAFLNITRTEPITQVFIMVFTDTLNFYIELPWKVQLGPPLQALASSYREDNYGGFIHLAK